MTLQFDEMYQALLDKDLSYEGLFVAAIKTTGIFCRSSCRARKPLRENVEFFTSSREALQQGYRPCKICHPLEPLGETPQEVAQAIELVEKKEDHRISDQELREAGIDPVYIRRWFKQHHGVTFQSYQRMARINGAYQAISSGETIVDSAYDSGYESLSGFSAAFQKILGEQPSKGGQQTLITIGRIQTLLGPMMVCVVHDQVCLLEFTDRRMLENELQDLRKRLKGQFIHGNHPLISQVQQELDEYFRGERKEFTLPLLTPGTDFQQAVWKELQTIPLGQTRSYGEQAKCLGNSAAVRAVARANGMNRIAIVIPCHRVIGKDGTLVGYAGGLARKKWLLEHEERMSVKK